MKYSVAFASQVDSWKWVRRAEELGFHAAWFYDTQLLNPDVFICMALAAHETTTIRLGTGVLVPSNRIEPVAANALASRCGLAHVEGGWAASQRHLSAEENARTWHVGAAAASRVRTYT